MAAAPLLMTIDDYFSTPETVKPAELAFGLLRVAESPTSRHQSTVKRMLLALEAHVASRALGEVWVAPLDVVLDAERALVVQPDLMFVSNARAAIVGDRVMGAPDLVIEVLSPNPRIGKTSEHLRWFAEYGVRECWIVHQQQTRLSIVEFRDRQAGPHRLFDARQPIRSSVLPEFSLSLSEILEAPSR